MSSKADCAAIDGAVIIGSSIEPLCEFIVSVTANAQVRLARIKTRDALTDEQARLRLDAQPDDDFYRAHSRYVISNNTTPQELEKEVCRLYNKIKEVEY
jgi:dephospho-CoA kinase